MLMWMMLVMYVMQRCQRYCVEELTSRFWQQSLWENRSAGADGEKLMFSVFALFSCLLSAPVCFKFPLCSMHTPNSVGGMKSM